MARPDRSRVLTARRTLSTERKLPPLRTVAIGPEWLFTEFARTYLERLAPPDVVHCWGAETEGFAILNQLPPARRRRLVIWHDFQLAPPGPETIGAVRTMSRLRGTWLLAHATSEELPQGWADAAVFDWTVVLRVSASERFAWLQTVVGGALSDAVVALEERAGHDLTRATGDARLVRAVTDKPTVADVELLTLADTGGDYIAALLACRARDAMTIAPTVSQPGYVLAVAEHRLALLHAMLELRPPAARRLPREVAAAVGAPTWAVEELVPLIPKYSRQRVRSRYLALAAARLELRRQPSGTGVLETLAADW